MEPVTTSAVAGAAATAEISATAVTATGGSSAAAIAKQADSVRRLASVFIKAVAMQSVGDSGIVDEFASPIYAGLSAVPLGPSFNASSSCAGGPTPEIVAPSAVSIPSVPASTGISAPTVAGVSEENLGPGVSNKNASGAPNGRLGAEKSLPVEKPEVRELVDRYYKTPSIKEQLDAGEEKIIVERNLREERVAVNGDKRTAYCLVEERIVDRKYLDHGNITELIAEVRHGNVPTIRQLYLAIIDLADLATFTVFQPLLAKVKLEPASYRLRQLTADFERRELSPSLPKESKEVAKLDRKIEGRSLFKTNHVVEKSNIKEVASTKQLEIVTTSIKDLCTVEFDKGSIEGFLERRNEVAEVFNDAGAIARLEGTLPPEAIAAVNEKALAWVRENVITTTTEYVNTETFHRYWVDFDGFLGKKVESSDKVVTREVKSTINEYLSPSDRICLEGVKSCEQAAEKFAALLQTVKMEFDPQVVESYIEPSAGVEFDEGWITYIPGGSIANLGLKSDLGCNVTGWDCFWAAVDIATIALAVCTMGASAGATSTVLAGAKAAGIGAARSAAKRVSKAIAKGAVKTAVKTAARQTGEVALKNAGKAAGNKALTTVATKGKVAKAATKPTTEKTAKSATKAGAKSAAKTGAEKSAETTVVSEAKQSGTVKIKNSGKAGTKAKPSADVSSPDVTYKNVPRSNGEWSGTPGDSIWKPDPKAKPANTKVNPNGKTYAQILRENNVPNGVKFKNGYPDFTDAAKDQVKVTNMTTNRAKNFAQADSRLAGKVRAGKADSRVVQMLERNGVDPKNATKGDIARLRSREGLTWHEHQDKQTIQLISKELHGTMCHKGGVSVLKQESKLSVQSFAAAAPEAANTTAKTAGTMAPIINS